LGIYDPVIVFEQNLGNGRDCDSGVFSKIIIHRYDKVGNQAQDRKLRYRLPMPYDNYSNRHRQPIFCL